MTIGIKSTLRDDRLEIIQDAIDAGGDEYGGGILQIYSGTRPATGGSASSCTKLLEFQLAWPCGSISAGVLTFDAAETVQGLAAGTATWARITDIDDNFVMDLSVTNESGGGDVLISNVVIALGLDTDLISASITEGNA